MLLIVRVFLLLLPIVSLAGCGTILPAFATLRCVKGAETCELEIETTQRNEFNFHSLGFDTYQRQHVLFLGSRGPIIDGSQIVILPASSETRHPTGTVQIQGDRLTIQLQAPYWDPDKKIYRFSDFRLNGTYKLREAPSAVSG